MSKIFSILVLTAAAMLRVHAATYYVDASRPDDTGVATNWVTAKQTIQAAVNLTVTNDTVLVTNGVYGKGIIVAPGYTLNNRVMITNSITLRSVNGPAVTVIEGSGTNWYETASAVRCVFMTRGVLDGFTLRQGATLGDTLSNNDYGGGLNMYGAAPDTIATNCFIINCRADRGGGSYGGKLKFCTLSGNIAWNGGGAYGGTLYNCVISSNTAPLYGGGVNRATLNNCKLIGNLGVYGGGSYKGTLENCILFGNGASHGGGSNLGTLNNCTISGNTTDHEYGGGGSDLGTLNNCIVWGNTCRVDGSVNNHRGNGIYYSCMTPLTPPPSSCSKPACTPVQSSCFSMTEARPIRRTSSAAGWSGPAAGPGSPSARRMRSGTASRLCMPRTGPTSSRSGS